MLRYFPLEQRGVTSILLPSQTIVGPLHSPFAPHTEVLSPPLQMKPSSQTNVATLPYVVPVTDSSTESSTVAGWPQSTTEWVKNIKNILDPASLDLVTISTDSGGTLTIFTMVALWYLGDSYLIFLSEDVSHYHLHRAETPHPILHWQCKQMYFPLRHYDIQIYTGTQLESPQWTFYPTA